MHTTVGLDAKEISNPQVRFRIQDVFPATCKFYILDSTPPKTNIEPENRPLKKENPIGHHHLIF